MKFVDQVEARLARATARAYRRCAENPQLSVHVLEDAAASYLNSLHVRAAETEFLDLATAKRVAEGCLVLLEQLRGAPDPDHHRVVQAAVDYFVLEDDAEDDASIVGFDDDLEVLRLTAEVLGWELPGSDA